MIHPLENDCGVTVAPISVFNVNPDAIVPRKVLSGERVGWKRRIVG
jgi:hypothetical protein